MMTKSERRFRDLFTRWWGGSTTRRAWLRRNRDQVADSARRAQGKLRDLRDSDAAHRAQERAQEALRDLRDSDAAHRAQERAQEALRDLRGSAAGHRAQEVLHDAETAARDAYTRIRRSGSR